MKTTQPKLFGGSYLRVYIMKVKVVFSAGPMVVHLPELINVSVTKVGIQPPTAKFDWLFTI